MKFLLKQDNIQLKVNVKSSLLGGDPCCRALGDKVQKGCHGAPLLLIPTLASTWASRAAQQSWMLCKACWCWRPHVHLLDVTSGFSLWAAGVWHQVLKAPPSFLPPERTPSLCIPQAQGKWGRMSTALSWKVDWEVQWKSCVSPHLGHSWVGWEQGHPPARPCPSGRSRWGSTKALWPNKLRYEPGPELLSFVLTEVFLTQAEMQELRPWPSVFSGLCLIKHYSAA